MDVRIILEVIDQLPLQAFEQVHQHVNERARQLDQIRRDNSKKRSASSSAARSKFRKGITQDEWKEIADAMNNK